MRKLITVLLLLPSVVFALPEHPLTPAQRVAEEKRIQQETENNLDWHNLDPQQLDGVADDKRLLYADPNTSILISRVDRRRFGLFEAINKEGILGYEIRFHKKNIVTNRFDMRIKKTDCLKAATINVEEKLKSGMIFRFFCKNEYDSESNFYYLFHSESGGLFRLIQIHDHIKYGPKATEKNGFYSIRWKLKPGGMLNENLIMKYEIKKKKGKWDIETIDNPLDWEGDAFEVDKLPLDHKYDLPDVINWDQ